MSRADRNGAGGDRLVAVAAGIGYVALCLDRRGRPDRTERRLFHHVNGTSDHWWWRVPQQLGTPWTLPAVAAVLAVRHQPRLALAALAALPVEKAAEVATKKLLQRPRPVAVVRPTLRDDAPREGPSQPSGHAAIAAAATYLLARGTGSTGVAVLGAAGTGLTSYVRVHQGAHWPSDVAAGVALGVAIGAGLGSVAADR